MSPKIAAIIPARMAASRFPGKPLLEVAGLPMVEHVRRRVSLSEAFSDIAVATCDTEIADVVQSHGGQVIMTSPEHEAATDRVAEAMAQVDCTHVVNVQGDEILVLPEDLQTLVQAIADRPDVPAWNAVSRIEHVDELTDPSMVKCVVSKTKRVLFCSRDFAFLGFDEGPFEPVRKILGILAYSGPFLARYNQMERTPLELLGSIDQSRIIENDVVLQTVEWPRGYPGINYPREVAVVEKYLEEDELQRAILARIS
jgi:3-deoxy-manno-octulosonate cytidylyltransferase (CMP-KDO synthetase)